MLQILLLLGGALSILTGYLINYWLPQIFFPPAIYLSLSGLAIGVGLAAWWIDWVRRRLGDFTFFIFLLLYLATTFLAYLNHMEPGFAVSLIVVHVLFSLSFRRIGEFFVFALASLVLFSICSFYVPQLDLPPLLFLSLIGGATVFSGVYLWLREKTLRQLGNSRQMLGDLLDNAFQAMFLLDQGCSQILYQNRLASDFLTDLDGHHEAGVGLLFRLLGPRGPHLLERLREGPLAEEINLRLALRNRRGQIRELEVSILPTHVLQEEHILVKIQDHTESLQQARSLHRSRAVNESLFNAIPDTLITLDLKGRIRSIRPGNRFQAPLELEVFLGKPIEKLMARTMPKAKQQEATRLFSEVRATGELRQMEFQSLAGKANMHFEVRMVRLAEGQEVLVILRDITEAREVAEALRLSEQNYKEIFNAGADGILILHPDDFCPTEVNQVAGLLLNRPLTELTEASICQLCESEEQQANMEAYLEAAIRGEVETFTCQMKQGHGQSLPVELTAELVVLGGEFRLMVILRDIEARKAAEDRLRLFRSLINQSSDAIFVIDPVDGTLIDFNDQMAGSLGYLRVELEKMNIAQFLLTRKSEPLTSSMLQGFQNREAAIFRGRLLSQDSSSFPVEVNLRYVEMGEREFLIGVARDITERLGNEEALRQSEEKYRMLVEKMNEGLVLTDAQETILFVNDRMCQILGLSAPELIGKQSYDILSDEEAVARVKSEVASRKDGQSSQYELQLRRANGDKIWVLITGAPYLDAGAGINGTIAIVTDISDRKRTEIKLQEKNRELDGFVYRASHDLKGPLASIIGVTNIAMEEVKDPRSIQYFELISKSTRRLDLILSELIDLTRINKAPVRPELIDIDELVEEVIQSLSHVPQANKVDFQVKVKVKEPLYSDRKILNSVLQNLIVNSIHYQNPAVAMPWVKVCVRSVHDKIEIKVEDNGVGIPPRIRQKVFEMFYRGNTHSKGSGLGLYIVKNSVGKLGGTTELTSEEGKGATFTITLPREVPETAERVREPDLPQA